MDVIQKIRKLLDALKSVTTTKLVLVMIIYLLMMVIEFLKGKRKH